MKSVPAPDVTDEEVVTAVREGRIVAGRSAEFGVSLYVDPPPDWRARSIRSIRSLDIEMFSQDKIGRRTVQTRLWVTSLDVPAFAVVSSVRIR